MSDLLFLTDLLLLLLSAYYTDRTANAFIASQSAANAEAQHTSALAVPAEQLSMVPDIRRASLSLGPDAQRHTFATAPQLDSLATAPRFLAKSLSRSKRDMVLPAGEHFYHSTNKPVCAMRLARCPERGAKPCTQTTPVQVLMVCTEVLLHIF